MTEKEFLDEIRKCRKYPWYFADKYCVHEQWSIDDFLYWNLISQNVPLSSYLKASKIKEKPIYTMNYDLSLKEDRKRFIKRANSLLKNERDNVSLTDESSRTLNQNSYLHVLCRILAVDTGVSEYYAKNTYFKELANKDIFVVFTKDPITNQMIRAVRSSSELTIQEMAKAIDNFHIWAAEHGYKLPEATLKEDGSLEFKSEEDKKAFHQAQINTSKLESKL